MRHGVRGIREGAASIPGTGPRQGLMGGARRECRRCRRGTEQKDYIIMEIGSIKQMDSRSDIGSATGDERHVTIAISPPPPKSRPQIRRARLIRPLLAGPTSAVALKW